MPEMPAVGRLRHQKMEKFETIWGNTTIPHFRRVSGRGQGRSDRQSFIKGKNGLILWKYKMIDILEGRENTEITGAEPIWCKLHKKNESKFLVLADRRVVLHRNRPGCFLKPLLLCKFIVQYLSTQEVKKKMSSCSSFLSSQFYQCSYIVHIYEFGVGKKDRFYWAWELSIRFKKMVEIRAGNHLIRHQAAQ